MKRLMITAFMAMSLLWGGLGKVYAEYECNSYLTEHRSINGFSFCMQNGNVLVTSDKEYEYVAIQIQSADGISYYECECSMSPEDAVSVPVCGLPAGDYRIFVYAESGLTICNFTIK